MPNETVPRDRVWTYARRAALPRQEYIRMAGGVEGAIGSVPRNPRARISREGAIRLLGEVELDRRWPQWGEHRAAVSSVPGARTHYGAFPWCLAPGHSPVDVRHEALVRRYGGAALKLAMEDPK